MISAFISDDFFNINLKDISGKNVPFSDFKNNKATVIVFLLTDCPASQGYTSTLNSISRQFKQNGISVVGVFPGNYSSEKEMKEFQSAYKINFQLLHDASLTLAKHLSAKVAPACFVVNSKGIIEYQGRIDDWFYTLGKTKPEVQVHDLQNALNSFVKGESIKVKKTSPVGCIIENEN